MRPLGFITAIILAVHLGACVPGGPSPEALASEKQKNAILFDEAKAGKITWVEYAKGFNANFLAMPGHGDNPEIQEALAYRVVLAQQVDARQITPEQFDYEWKKYLADAHREQVNRAIAIMAATPAPVTCYHTGYVSTCY